MGSMYTFLKNMLDLNLLEAINKESLNPVDKLVFDKKIYQYLVISDSLNWKKNLRIVPGLKHQMEVGLFRE